MTRKLQHPGKKKRGGQGASDNPALPFPVLLLLVCSLFGIAGALFMAMLFSFFTLDQQGIRLAAGTIVGGLLSSFIDAMKVGLFSGFPLGCIIGIVTTAQERRTVHGKLGIVHQVDTQW